MTNATSIARRNNLADQPVFSRVAPSAQQRKMLQNAMRDLMAGYPFLASLSASDSVRYHVVAESSFPIAATDGVGIYLNARPEGYFDERKWTDDHRVFALAHEVLHVMREDIPARYACLTVGFVNVPRTPVCPTGQLPFNDGIYQRAMDAVINATLVADNVGKPLPGVVLHPAITPDMSTGQAYAILYQENQGKSQGKSQPGQGQGQGDPMGNDTRDPGSMGDPYGDSSEASSQPQDPQDAARALAQGAPERQVAIDRAVNAARQAGAGTSHAEAMTAASREPGIDWRSYIQGFLARAAGNSAWDFRRPSRPPLLRGLVGETPFYSPARGGNGCNHVVFVGDTSGSIGEDEHRAMLATVCEMMRDLNPRYLSVVWCDSAVQRVDMFSGTPGADALEEFYNRQPIPRGGGTSFVPPFEMMDSVSVGGTLHMPSSMPSQDVGDLLDAGSPDGLIYFTDLYGSAPAEKPDYPVLWVAVTEKPHPWGERVTINPAELV